MVEGSTRNDRRKARTRARILDAAEQRFAAVGAEAATVEQIADTADVAVATVYLHFARKDDLHLAVIERALDENERHMLAVYGSEVPPVERLIDAAGAYLRFYLETPHLFRLVALPSGPLSVDADPGPAAVVVAERVDRMTLALAGTVQQGVKDRSLRDVSPLESARFLWGGMNGVIALAMRPDPLRLSERELLAALAHGLEIMFEGLVSDARRGDDGRLAPELRARLRKAIKRPTAR
jgi:AcrR family transcriptional regulator